MVTLHIAQHAFHDSKDFVECCLVVSGLEDGDKFMMRKNEIQISFTHAPDLTCWRDADCILRNSA